MTTAEEISEIVADPGVNKDAETAQVDDDDVAGEGGGGGGGAVTVNDAVEDGVGNGEDVGTAGLVGAVGNYGAVESGRQIERLVRDELGRGRPRQNGETQGEEQEMERRHDDGMDGCVDRLCRSERVFVGLSEIGVLG